MNELQLRLEQTLFDSAKRLRNAGLPVALVAKIEQLSTEVHQPCIVAVVGRVKAGKSTFINALLGEDLAKVGPTETTATINYFSYGIPPDPEHPVRCHWHDGRITDESRQFLDERQGNEFETLRKADEIAYLEFHLPNPYLEQITLVDTPGTGSEIETHQQRTEEYFNLARQLRQRHDQDTRRIGREADAVIYLVGEVAKELDKAFLEEFQEATQQGQSRALNAIGVMAKIDLNPEIVRQREELSQTITRQLQQSLSNVIPVSAGIQRAIDDLLAQDCANLKQMMTTLRTIDPLTLEDLLSDSRWYLDVGCPISVAAWEHIRGQMPWRVFTTIARVAATPSLDEDTIIEQLQTIAGFDQLHKKLDQHFVKRGSSLRSWSIVSKALQVLNELKFTYLPEFFKREAENALKRERFLAFIRQIQGNSPVARELGAFVEERLAPRPDVKKVLEEVERELARIKYELEDDSMDYVALEHIETHQEMLLLSTEELNELQPLFGLYGLEIEKRLPLLRTVSNHGTLFTYLEARQEYWDRKSQKARGQNLLLYDIAQQAQRRYGLIANTLLQAGIRF